MRWPNTNEFDEYIINENGEEKSVGFYDLVLDGHNHSFFVRADSWFFKDLCDDILNNPNSSYVTYLNDFIKENYDGISIPTGKVNCFKKCGLFVKREELISKLARLMQVPTTYVRYVDRFTKEDVKKYFNYLLENRDVVPRYEDYENYILSVDFISKNEQFNSLNDYAGTEICANPNPNPMRSLKQWREGTSLKDWHEEYMNATLVNPHTKEVIPNEVKENLFRQFVPQYLFKTYVARDCDVKSENIGILYNTENRTYKLAPMFDYEFSFYNAEENIPYDFFEKDFGYAMQIFPEETNKFINALFNLNIDKFVNENINENEILKSSEGDANAKTTISTSLMMFKHYIYEFASRHDLSIFNNSAQM